MFHLGFAYSFNGWGLKRDSSLSMEWFLKAVERDNGCAAAHLACSFRLSLSKEQVDLFKKWSTKALQSNDLYALAYCHFHFVGAHADCSKALEEFEKSANQGNEFAQYYAAHLLTCKSDSNSIRSDQKKAFDFLLKAAEKGLYIAQVCIADMYRFGRGCTRSQERVDYWSKKANSQNGQ